MRNASLSDDQQQVLFEGATEAPFSGALLYHEEQGEYTCANCGAVLFASKNKYDSGCGWPSFDKVVEGAVSYSEDTSHGMTRTEISCTSCKGHLGHVFPDGPADTTGRRYCVNSLSLSFTRKSV